MLSPRPWPSTLGELPAAFRRLLGLTWLCCGRTPPAELGPLQASSDSVADQELTRLALGHGVLYWLLSHLESPDQYLGADLLESWRRLESQNRLRSLANGMWVVRLVKILQDAGIRCLPIKGVSTAIRYYGSISARPCGDIDLMVDWAELEPARQALLQLGLKQTFPDRPLNRAETRWLRSRKHHLTFNEPTSGLMIELHWALHDDRLLERQDNGWARQASEQLRIGSSDIAALDPASDYMLLLTHAARSTWSRMKWLLDAHLAWEALSPEQRRQVVQEIRTLRLEAAQNQFLALTSILFGTPLPIAAKRLPWQLAFLLDLGEKRKAFTKLGAIYTRLQLRRNFNYRWDAFRSTMITWGDIDLLSLPAFAFPLYVPLRLPMFLYRRLSGRHHDH